MGVGMRIRGMAGAATAVALATFGLTGAAGAQMYEGTVVVGTSTGGSFTVADGVHGPKTAYGFDGAAGSITPTSYGSYSVSALSGTSAWLDSVSIPSLGGNFGLLTFSTGLTAISASKNATTPLSIQFVDTQVPQNITGWAFSGNVLANTSGFGAGWAITDTAYLVVDPTPGAFGNPGAPDFSSVNPSYQFPDLTQPYAIKLETLSWGGPSGGPKGDSDAFTWFGPGNMPDKVYGSNLYTLVDLWTITPDHPSHGLSVQLSGAIQAVPEPSSWAMLGVGIAGLGFVGLARRRKRGRYAF